MRTLKQRGFSLLELLLVMVIISGFLVMGVQYQQQQALNTRIDKTVLQLQYLLNAGLAYFVANGAWPGDPDTEYLYDKKNIGGLQGSYIDNAAMPSPWGNFYATHWNTTGAIPPPHNAFVATIWIPMATPQGKGIADTIAGRMPASTIQAGAGGYRIFVWVNAPGANLAGAAAVNFAGLYHHGACVPVPSCPDTSSGGGQPMIPQVFVVPISVSGVNDQSDNNNVYPISSFTAYAKDPKGTPDACYYNDAATDCQAQNPQPATGKFWRVCLQIITERGDVQETRTDAWGDNVTLAAFTRCAIPDEPQGSNLNVFTH